MPQLPFRNISLQMCYDVRRNDIEG